MPKPHKDLEAVFVEAIELHTPDTWERFLEVRCAGHDDLKNQAAELLKGYADSNGFMSQSVPTVLCPQVPLECQATAEGIAEKFIGSYQLLECLGEGGMGKVFLAEQTKPIRRLVALKTIKPGMDSREIARRFEAERQTLALMNHPGIAQVLEAGATDSGVPYFVMELVRGEPITGFCDRLNMTIADRLRLMISVCGAIQHAHQKGIVHQDLKPTNVLVTIQDGKPVPKVIDFGIAKAVGPENSDPSVQTVFHQSYGTPGYMSPEQFQLNRPATDIRTDVYSLGVLIYELLTGCTPSTQDAMDKFRGDGPLTSHRSAAICNPSDRLMSYSKEELDAIAAKRGVTSTRLISAVRGDPDWIVMKALAQEMAQRYETVASLSGDLQRYFDHEPVTASPPSARYRLHKAWQRHRLLISLVSALAVTLCAGLGFSIRQAVVARRAMELSRTYLKIAEDRQKQFQNLASRAGIREAYAAWERNQYFETTQALRSVRQTDSEASSRLEWKLINNATTQVYRRLFKSEFPLHELRVIPGTNLVAVAGEDGYVRLVDADSGYVVKEFKTPAPRLHALAISADGLFLATGGVVDPVSDRSVPLVYEISTGRCVHELPGQPTTIESLEFSADGLFLACGCRYEPVMNYELATHAVTKIPSTRRNTWLATTRDSQLLFSEFDSATVQISDPHDSQFSTSVSLGSRIVTSFLHPQRNILLSVVPGEQCSILTAIGERNESFPVRRLCGLQGLVGHPKIAIDDGARFLCAGLEYGEVICYPLTTVAGNLNEPSRSAHELPQIQAVSRQHVSDHAITSMCFHQGWWLITTFNGELLAVRQQAPTREIFTKEYTPGTEDPRVDTAFTAPDDGKMLLVGRNDGSVARIDLTGTQSTAAGNSAGSDSGRDEVLPPYIAPAQFPGVGSLSSPAVTTIAISKDQKKIAVVRNTRDVILIDNGSVRTLQTLTPEMMAGQKEIMVLDAIAFSDDGNWLSWTGDRSLSYARIDTSVIEVQNVLLPGLGRCVLWSPDGTEIAIGGAFQAIGRVSVREKSLQLEPLEGSEVHSLRYLGNRNALLTGHSDGSIQLRDRATGTLRSLHVHHSAVIDIALSDKGEAGLAADSAGNIAVFSLQDNERPGLLYQAPEQFSSDGNRVNPRIVLSENSGFLNLITQKNNSTVTLQSWPLR